MLSAYADCTALTVLPTVRAYSTVYAAINDGTVTMYTGDGGTFYANGSQVSQGASAA